MTRGRQQMKNKEKEYLNAAKLSMKWRQKYHSHHVLRIHLLFRLNDNFTCKYCLDVEQELRFLKNFNDPAFLIFHQINLPNLFIIAKCSCFILYFILFINDNLMVSLFLNAFHDQLTYIFLSCHLINKKNIFWDLTWT